MLIMDTHVHMHIFRIGNQMNSKSHGKVALENDIKVVTSMCMGYLKVSERYSLLSTTNSLCDTVHGMSEPELCKGPNITLIT